MDNTEKLERIMQIGMSQSLRQLVERAREGMPTDQFEDYLRRLVGGIAFEMKYLEGIPAGSTQAKIIHIRIQAAIQSYLKADPKVAVKISCTRCTTAGCCRTNVDISTDEAKLMMDLIKGGVQVDRARLEMQAQIPDDETYVEAWGALSFEQRTCVFLTGDNRCGIYEHRPLVCRKWFTVEDPSHCDDYHGRGRIVIVPPAEIIASAHFSARGEDNVGRLPKMLLAALTKEGL